MSCLLGKHRSVRDKSATAPAGCRTPCAQLDTGAPIPEGRWARRIEGKGTPRTGDMGRLVGMAAFPFLRRGERGRPTSSFRCGSRARARPVGRGGRHWPCIAGARGRRSLISSFKAGVLTDENASNPEEKDYATQAGSHPEVGLHELRPEHAR